MGSLLTRVTRAAPTCLQIALRIDLQRTQNLALALLARRGLFRLHRQLVCTGRIQKPLWTGGCVAWRSSVLEGPIVLQNASSRAQDVEPLALRLRLTSM